MQHEKQSINNLRTIDTLIKIVSQNYEALSNNMRAAHLYNTIEDRQYGLMSDQQLINVFEILDKELASLLNFSTFYDIKFSSINPDKSKRIALERIIFNIKMRIHLRTHLQTDDEFSKELYYSYQNDFFISSYLENNIRKIYLNLLSAHLKESDNTSLEYRSHLKELEKELRFKYRINVKYCYDYAKTFIDIHCKPYHYEQYLNNYIDSLITSTMKEILKFSDEELEKDENYALGIEHQILLRTLFIIIDDYERLATYEQIYNDLEKKETIAKSIIRTAFISNYHDLQEFNKRKIKEDSK